MIAGIVLASLAGVAPGAELVHRKGDCLMGLDAQGTEGHRACHEMLDDALYRLDLIERNRHGSLPEAHEIPKEYRSILLVYHPGPLLELLVGTHPGGYLEVGDGVRIPCMVNSVTAVAELAVVRKELIDLSRLESLVMKPDGIRGNVAEADSADCGNLGSEICPQKILAQTYAFEYLGATVRADCGYSHL